MWGGQIPQPSMGLSSGSNQAAFWRPWNPHLQIFLDSPPFLGFLYAFWTLTVFYLNASSNSCNCSAVDPHIYHRGRKQRLAKTKVPSKSLKVAGSLAGTRIQVSHAPSMPQNRTPCDRECLNLSLVDGQSVGIC